MKSRIKSFGVLILILGFYVGALPAHAIQFRMLGWASADVNLQFEINKKPTEACVFTDDLSPLYNFKAEGPLVLYKMVANKEGKPVKQVACTVPIPAGMEQGLLILLPGDDTKASSRRVLPNQFGFVSDTAPLIYDYIWLDASQVVRPSGTIEFINMSRVPIALQIEQRQLNIAPQAKAQIPMIAGAKRMNFKAAAQVDGRWRVFESNPLCTRGPDRMLVILRDGPAVLNATIPSGEPNISMLSLFEWPQPPPAPEIGPMASSNR